MSPHCDKMPKYLFAGKVSYGGYIQLDTHTVKSIYMEAGSNENLCLAESVYSHEDQNLKYLY